MLAALGRTKCRLKRSASRAMQPLPDIDELNAKIPEEEWETGLDGKPRPPWQKQYIVYLVDPTDAGIYTYINGTFGARIAFDRLKIKGRFDAPAPRRQRRAGGHARRQADENQVRPEVEARIHGRGMAPAWWWRSRARIQHRRRTITERPACNRSSRCRSKKR